MQQLLRFKNAFRITTLTPEDVRRSTDHVAAFRKLILPLEQTYPRIEQWLEEKALPGVVSGDRTGFVGYLDETPVVSALVRGGERAKICHLRIGDELQDSHLGELFFALMILEVRHGSEEIHFTLPETLWRERKDFFRSFGFATAQEVQKQYRLFDRELRCSAPFRDTWAAAASKLPKLLSLFASEDLGIAQALLLSVSAPFAERIVSGRKTVEIRRRFSDRWIGRRVWIYASRPISSIVGEAVISDVHAGAPSEIWETCSASIGCTKDEYARYCGESEKVHAISLSEVRPYRVRMSLSELGELSGGGPIRPPQSYASAGSSRSLAKALSIATALQERVPPLLAL